MIYQQKQQTYNINRFTIQVLYLTFCIVQLHAIAYLMDSALKSKHMESPEFQNAGVRVGPFWMLQKRELQLKGIENTGNPPTVTLFSKDLLALFGDGNGDEKHHHKSTSIVTYCKFASKSIYVWLVFM